MQPKPIAARFITADDQCVVGQMQPALRARNFFEHAVDRAGRNLTDPRPLPSPVVKPSFQLRSPSSNASSRLIAEVFAGVDSVVRVMVIIVTSPCDVDLREA